MGCFFIGQGKQGKYQAEEVCHGYSCGFLPYAGVPGRRKGVAYSAVSVRREDQVALSETYLAANGAGGSIEQMLEKEFVSLNRGLWPFSGRNPCFYSQLNSCNASGVEV